MKKKHLVMFVLSIILLAAFMLNFSSCVDSAHAQENLMDKITPNSVAGREADKNFILSQAEFAVSVFKKTAEKNQNENILVSPFSLMLALAMTANGADGETKAELEEVLGKGLKIEELNEYLYYYRNRLTNDENVKINTANAVFIRDTPDFNVKTDFLQKNADYYNASAFKSPFDSSTVKSINEWAKDNTDGMIEEIINELDADSMMLLINALTFDAKWYDEYIKEDIKEGYFTCADKSKVPAFIMGNEENKYISTDISEGIIKSYKGGNFSLAALLPNEGTTLNELIASLSGESLIKTLRNPETFSFYAALPKFTYDSDYKMKEILQDIGIKQAFGGGFSGIEDKIGLYVNDVIHKTHISVDECGTKAGALSSVEILRESISIHDHEKEIIFDRPFVYAIIDNSTCLPIFIGAVNSVG